MIAVQMKTKNPPRKNTRKQIKYLITLKQNQNNSGKYSINIFFKKTNRRNECWW